MANNKKQEDARKRWEQYRSYGSQSEGRFGGQPREELISSQRGVAAGDATDRSNDSVLSQKTGGGSSGNPQQGGIVAGDKPGAYNPQNQQQIDSLYDQIVNRQPFNFDLDGNALYQQYRDQYTRLGQQAMQDTMGQAAGLTGGYGSSYGQSVGQQAYNAYLQELNNVVPDLYAQARSEYDAQGQNLMNLYGLAVDRENQDYGRYADAYNRWLQEYAMAQDQRNWEEELAFQREQWEWQKAQAGRSGGGSGGSYGGSGSSGGAGSSGSNEPTTVYAGGFTSDDLAGIAQDYINRGMPYGTSSPELTRYLASLGLDSVARASVVEALKEYGAELGKQYYKGKGGGGGGKSTIART